MLQRKGREYFARINAVEPTDVPFFVDRSVLLTIGEPGTEPMLRRKLDVGVVVFLGTDLRLTGSCFLEAELLPDSYTEIE